jgi:hypothetical protein
MSGAIFIVNKVSGDLTIGDKHEIDKATWRQPRGIRLTPTSRYIRDMLFPKRQHRHASADWRCTMIYALGLGSAPMGVNAEPRKPALARLAYILSVGLDPGSGPTGCRIG